LPAALRRDCTQSRAGASGALPWDDGRERQSDVRKKEKYKYYKYKEQYES